MRKKTAMLLSILLVVGSLSVVPMFGGAATPHVFHAFDEALLVGTITNATDTEHPNGGIARMYDSAVLPTEVSTTWPDTTLYPGTTDLVGALGASGFDNAFAVDTNGFDTDWANGDTFIFTVERDPNSGLDPDVYQTGTVPKGYVASTSVAIDQADDPQEVGSMTLEAIPTPIFTFSGGLYYIDWTPMTTPNIESYIIYNGTTDSGPWSVYEYAASPPSTLPAESGLYYSLGLNWTNGVTSLVQGGTGQYNARPDLNWTGEAGFTTDGVNPDSGTASCAFFEFRINYTDLDNDEPNTSGVQLHLWDGATVTPYPMSAVVPGDLTYSDGKLYATVPMTLPVGTYSYWFSAFDKFNTPPQPGAFGLQNTSGPTVTANTAPTITITIPAGGESWTGGSNHTITMTITDDDVTIPNLWLNYTTGGSYTPIAALTNVLTSLGLYYWDPVASINSATVVVRAELTDSCGVTASDDSLAFEIDSTAPIPTMTTPAVGATGVSVSTNVVITFDEGMNTSSLSFTLKNDATGAVVAGSGSWAGNVYTFNPTADLSQNTVYRVIITTATKDDSDPGNPLASEYNVTFTTVSGADTVLPVITHTPVTTGTTGVSITISAQVTDNVGVGTVTLNYTDALGNGYNVTMTLSAGNYTASIPAQTAAGPISYTIWANDTSGNLNKTGPHTITITSPPPCSAAISGKIVDEDGNPVQGAKVEVLNGTTVLGSDTTDANGNYSISGLPCGSYSLKVTKSGFEDKTQTINTNTADQGTLTIKKVQPAQDWLWLIILLIVIIVVVLILVLLLMKRKKKTGEEAPPPTEEAAEETTEEVVEEEAAPEEGTETEEVVEEVVEEEIVEEEQQ